MGWKFFSYCLTLYMVPGFSAVFEAKPVSFPINPGLCAKKRIEKPSMQYIMGRHMTAIFSFERERERGAILLFVRI